MDTASQQPNTQPSAPQNTQQVQPPHQGVTTTPVGKEHEAIGVVTPMVKESIPSVESVVAQEVKDAGVEVVQEEPVLNQDHHAAGITLAKETTPVSTEPHLVELPGDYKAPQGINIFHQQVKKSVTWFRFLLWKVLKMKEAQKK
ncbi:MAG TPA: hypothetical protein VFQ63_02335 [Patescibacteria group bacterium]|nr:hypothetical protein [Patescibacteria group bacterium]